MERISPSVRSASTMDAQHSELSRQSKRGMKKMTDKYLDALLTVSEVMRAHNRLRGGISHEEACKRILAAVRATEGHDEESKCKTCKYLHCLAAEYPCSRCIHNAHNLYEEKGDNTDEGMGV